MDLKSSVVLVVLTAVCLVKAQYKEFNTSVVYVKVLELGAVLTTAMSPNIAADNRKVTLEILELSEVTNDGTFTPIQVLPLTALTYDLIGQFDVINVLQFTYIVATATEPSSGIFFAVNIAIVQSEGEVDIAGEKTAVAVGDVKIQLTITGDSFSNVADALLELKMKVKGISSTPTIKTANPGTDGVAYELGDGALLKLSKKVIGRSQTTTLTDQTLKLENGNVMIRFPRVPTNMRITYAWFIVPAPTDATFTLLGTYVKIKGMAGTTTISTTPALDADPNRATLTFLDLKVTDASNTVYSSSTFTDVRLAFDVVKNVTVSASEIPASMVKGSTQVMGGVLEVYLYIFTADGVMTQTSGGIQVTNSTVTAGDVQLELMLKGYTLGLDRFLDVSMDITGPSAPTQLVAETDDVVYDLGNNHAAHLSRKVSIGADYYNMSSDYPRLESGTTFVFRFPSFDGKTLSYGVIIKKLEETQTTDNKSVAATLLSNRLVAFAFILSTLLC